MTQSAIAFIVGIVILLFLLLKTKLNAFISLIIASVFIGVASGIGGVETMSAIKSGFSSTSGSVGIVIIFGTILGLYLEKSKAANQLAHTILKAVGEKNSTLAMSISGFIVSIPVFCDVAQVMLAPLYKSICKRKKLPVGPIATALALGLLVSNSLVPPTPGPIAVAGLLNLDLGRAIGYGLLVGVFAMICGWAYCQFYLSKKPESWYSYADESVLADVRSGETDKEEDLVMPNFLVAILPILIPIILIMLNTTCSVLFDSNSSIVRITKFLGESNMAIMIGVVSAIVLLKKYLKSETIYEVMNEALKTSGMIIFITAAGGSLAKVISATGMDATIADVLIASHLPIVIIPFLIAGFSKFVQGSGSVAMIMAATLCAPLVTTAGVDPVLIFLSACAGSSFGSQINNSFFWVFVNLNGYDTKTGLKTLCVGQQIIGIAGLIGTLVVSMFI